MDLLSLYLLGATSLAIFVALFVVPKIIDLGKLKKVERFNNNLYVIIFSIGLPISTFILFPIMFWPIIFSEQRYIHAFLQSLKDKE